ncbi:MAG: glycosyltransferase family 2 protein [Actinobacteria bacterium]|nr:glycosyltransferase family 2 protein [Actinomycetota bacterium]
MQLTVIVPTFNEAPNVAELVRRIDEATVSFETEIIFVDDSTDATPDAIRAAAEAADLPVRLIHRDKPAGGLGGAVVEGMLAAASDLCLVMDGDLQHPPEDIPSMVHRFRHGDVDVVVASRYVGDGDSGGLADRSRVLVSRASTALTKAMFPVRLKGVSDPMTGFFLVDRRAIDLEGLKPRGFKILLEILARRSLRVAEVPFRFAERFAGESKASFRQGLHFLTQLTGLRFGKMSLFAIIGGLGAIANLAIMYGFTHTGMNYLVAAVIAAEITILANFFAQERFVFHDMKGEANGTWSRFLKSFAFNNAEAVIRIPAIALLVNTWHISSVIAAGMTLVVAFFVRFLFHSLVVYAPRRVGEPSRAQKFVDELDTQAVRPGEL